MHFCPSSVWKKWALGNSPRSLPPNFHFRCLVWSPNSPCQIQVQSCIKIIVYLHFFFLKKITHESIQALLRSFPACLASQCRGSHQSSYHQHHSERISGFSILTRWIPNYASVNPSIWKMLNLNIHPIWGLDWINAPIGTPNPHNFLIFGDPSLKFLTICELNKITI